MDIQVALPAAAARGSATSRCTLTDAAKHRLARDGYDPVYGARPLKRLIQQEIENPLARRLLAGEYLDGDHVEIDVAGEGFAFRKTEAVTAA